MIRNLPARPIPTVGATMTGMTRIAAAPTTLGCPEDPTAYPVLREVRPRYADLGPDGKVSTIALARWFEDARVLTDLPLFRRLVQDGGMGNHRVLLANQRIEKLTHLPADGRYRVGVGTRRVGSSSFTYGYGVFLDGWCVAVADSVTVFATSAGPAALPDQLRGDLAALCLDEPGPPAAPAPPAERRDPSWYQRAHAVDVRIADIDTNRHVNNVALLWWYADAIADWQLDQVGRPLGGPSPDLAPVRWNIQYVAEVTYPGTYDLRLSVTEEAAGEMRYACGLFDRERCVGLADAAGAARP